MEAKVLNTELEDLFQRHPSNPLLQATDWPYAAHTVFNPGAVRLASGETLLLARVEDRRGFVRSRGAEDPGRHGRILPRIVSADRPAQGFSKLGRFSDGCSAAADIPSGTRAR